MFQNANILNMPVRNENLIETSIMRTIRNACSKYSACLSFLFCFIILSVGFFPINSFSQTRVHAYQPGVTATGITYFLPITKLRISVTAKRTIYKPGEYHDFATLYLRLNNVAENTYSTWEINSIKIEPYGVANKEQAYSIEFKKKSIAPLVGLAPDGRLLSINTAAPDETPLTMPSVTPGKADAENGTDFMTAEILSAGNRAKMAELAAGEIYDIRENRALLSKGQADFMPKDGEQLRLMLESLDKQEAGLLSLFKGTYSEETHVFVFDYTTNNETTADLLFRFSKHYGIVENDDLGGTPYYISVIDNRSLPTEVAEPGKAMKGVEKDVRYIVPGSAQIKIFNNNGRALVDTNIQMAQFGRVEYLGGELLRKDATTKLQFSPVTGGIVSITK